MSPLTQGPSHREDPHLKDRLNQIAEKITSPAFLSGQGLGNEIGFWIFDYPPEHELQVREYLTFVEGVLSRQHSELTVDHVNLLRVLRDYLHARSFLDKAIAMQPTKGDAALLKALRGPLHMDKFAPFLIRHALSDDPDIILLSGVGSVWPVMRAHSLLNALHGRLGHKPLVLFYHGSTAALLAALPRPEAEALPVKELIEHAYPGALTEIAASPHQRGGESRPEGP